MKMNTKNQRHTLESAYAYAIFTTSEEGRYEWRLLINPLGVGGKVENRQVYILPLLISVKLLIFSLVV